MKTTESVRAVAEQRSAGEGFAVLRPWVPAEGLDLAERLEHIRASHPKIAVRGLAYIKLNVSIVTQRQLRPNAHRLADVSLLTAIQALEKALPQEKEKRYLTITGARLDWIDTRNTRVITGLFDADSQRVLDDERLSALEVLEGLNPGRPFDWSPIDVGVSLGTLPRQQTDDYLNAVEATIADTFATPAQLALGPMQAILADHSKPTRPNA